MRGVHLSPSALALFPPALCIEYLFVVLPLRQLLVAGIHQEMGEEDLRSLFEPFGPLLEVSIQRDESGASKGTAAVVYSRLADAQVWGGLRGSVAIGLPRDLFFVFLPANVCIARHLCDRSPCESSTGPT